MSDLGTSAPSFSFHIESGEPQSGDAIPASVLVQILQSAQQAFELIGVHVEGRSIRSRARVSAQTSLRFQLVCQLPKPGCYAVPVTVGGTHELNQPELAEKALDIFQGLMRRISAHSSDGLADVLPDERIRRRVLELAKGMAPRAGAKWTLNLHDGADNEFAVFNSDTIEFIQDTLVPVEQREAARVVTGELKNIDFIEHKLTIIYPPTSKVLECIYDESLEDLLYERRRDLIQVTGRVVLNDQGEPLQIIDVSDIRDLDLSPIEFDVIESGELTLSVSPELSLQVETDGSKQLLCVENSELGILAFAPTRESLFDEVNAQVAMLWSEYAKASDDELDGPAKELKQALIKRFIEVIDAA